MATIEDFANTLDDLSEELARRIDELFEENKIDLDTKERLSGIVEGLGSIEQDLRRWTPPRRETAAELCERMGINPDEHDPLEGLMGS